MIEIDIEQGMPKAHEAINDAVYHIKQSKKMKRKVICFIHGYGSSGKGGAIQKRLLSKLKTELLNKNIKGYINGGKFNMYDSYGRDLKERYPETQKYYGKGNDGITIVEI